MELRGFETPDLFHAIDSRPVWWTSPEPGDWSRASALDRDFARGLVNSLVISVVVRGIDRLGSHWSDNRTLARFDSRPKTPDIGSVPKNVPDVTHQVLSSLSDAWQKGPDSGPTVDPGPPGDVRERPAEPANQPGQRELQQS